MNLNTMTLLELNVLCDALDDLTYKNPQLDGLRMLQEEAQQRIDADPHTAQYKALYEQAVAHGIEEGYAQPQDYYFALMKRHLSDRYKLILCYKCEWFRHGEMFNPAQGSRRSRNFEEFLPDDMQGKGFDPGYIEAAAVEKVRDGLLAAGCEEKPELVSIQAAFSAAIRAR